MLSAKVHALQTQASSNDPANFVATVDVAKPVGSRHAAGVPAAVFMKNKYWLVIETLPTVALAVIVRAILENVVDKWNGYYAINDVTLILTGAIFIVGFMMSGVIADYKEAEKIPGEIAGVLFGIEETLALVVPLKVKKPHLTPVATRTAMLGVIHAVLKYLGGGDERNDQELFAVVNKLNVDYTSPVFDAGPNFAVRLHQEVARLRGLLTRVAIISHSTYLPAGYAVVELFVTMAHVIVVLAKYNTVANAYAVIVGVSLIYGGMLRLMTDVDDPFEYEHIHEHDLPRGQDGGTEVLIDVLLEYRRALKERLAESVEKETAEKAAAAATVTA